MSAIARDCVDVTCLYFLQIRHYNYFLCQFHVLGELLKRLIIIVGECGDILSYLMFVLVPYVGAAVLDAFTIDIEARV